MFQNFVKDCSSHDSVVTNSDMTEFLFIDVASPMITHPNRVLKAVGWDGLPISRSPVRIIEVISAPRRVRLGQLGLEYKVSGLLIPDWLLVVMLYPWGTASVILGKIRTSSGIVEFCFPIGYIVIDMIPNTMLIDVPENALTCFEQ